MTEQERRKGGGSKLSRSETVTVRLDPKLRYLAELAARKHRRTLSSFIEWAIEDSLSRVWLEGDISIADMAGFLWDVDESDRFARLALRYPELLTHDEQVLWKLIKESGFLWRGKHDSDGDWSWVIKEQSLLFDRLRDNWELFKEVAAGERDKSALPKVVNKIEEHPIADWNPDDDIPF